MGRKREHSLVHLAPRDAVPMRHRTIVVGGYTVLDVVVTPGGRWNSAGGTAGNVAASMAHLGWTSSLVARIGRDAAGRAVQRRLLRVGVSTRALILDPHATTPILRHEVSAAGPRYRFGCDVCGRGRAVYRAPHSNEAGRRLPRSAPAVFFFDRPSRINLELAETYSAAGSLIFYEPSTLSTARAHERASALAHILKYSVERLRVLHERLPRPRGGQLTVITDGARGASYKIGRSRSRHLPAKRVKTVDAGGAGDWMTAGLLHRLPRHWDPPAVDVAVEWAQSLAALSTLLPGAQSLAWASSKTSTTARVRAVSRGGNPRLVLQLPSSRRRGVCRGCQLPTL